MSGLFKTPGLFGADLVANFNIHCSEVAPKKDNLKRITDQQGWYAALYYFVH